MDTNAVRLPVVCTRGVVVFPNQEVVIDVGRLKSLKAIDFANDYHGGKVFVVCQNDQRVNDPSIDDIYQVGTICRIAQVRKEKGFLRVKFSGLQRARIQFIEDDKDCMMGVIEPLVEDEYSSRIDMKLVNKIAEGLELIADVGSQFPSEVVTQLAKGVPADVLANHFAQYFPMNFDKRQSILEASDLNERLALILEEIEVEKHLHAIEKQISDKVKERVDENQKEYYLRERLRVIKEELGDVTNSTDDVEQMRLMIEENPYPANVKARMREELQRYEMMPQASAESSVLRNYLDWIFKVPWYQSTEDETDLNAILKVLDEDHFGLQKVKERILEYIAVKNMTKSLNAPILCLVGPPGVGKTSLAKSVARALNREFVKMSLGGVHDEAEIRGHRRTYLGSMPGRIIQGMKKAGVTNPVFLIDELDKMASDYKGDPSSAMLEVLDPEQNSMFSDHYLEEPYDLSNVLFIATANYLENIPGPLRDRLEIIELSSYTEEEKMHIAKEHLIPKQAKLNGLKPSQCKIKDEELLYLIRYYTKESGVRQLERMIASVCRKTVLAILKDNKKRVQVSKKLINEWLGKEIYSYGTKEKENQVGIVTGLAYTSFGGDILPIEVTHFDGKGNVIVTGHLGDVMKESATVAVGYVKSHAKEYGIDPVMFEKQDIQIHVPEGAVPKDGPSAGITLTTAVISALTNKPVYSDLAMTGEVTLRGNVLAIGGIKEKSMAAHRSGIQRIVMPKTNVKDMDEIPQIVKDNITFIPVETVDQVIEAALVK
ncbi:MAG: endopeptidase La [Erysipelotrichaceae bacterium]|nr:endopeptidase La [Erysipelotrichaceae bacterium]